MSSTLSVSLTIVAPSFRGESPGLPLWKQSSPFLQPDICKAKKPDATTAIDSAHFRETVWPLPASDLFYVGRVTAQKLARYGIHTIGDLARTDTEFLHRLLGKNGLMLWMFANGQDTSEVSDFGSKGIIKTIGNSTTSPRDLVTDKDIKITLYILSESVAERLRACDFLCRTV